MMQLLDEAIERLTAALAPYGRNVGAVRNSRATSRALSTLRAALSPLRPPPELSEFWERWDADSFNEPVFDGLDTPARSLVMWRNHVELGYPRILLPIGSWTQGAIWLELESDAHPGGRVFHSWFDEGTIRLWTIGVSGLLDLVSETIEQYGTTHRVAPTLDVHDLPDEGFAAVLEATTASMLAPPGDWSVDLYQRDRWPAHWQEADGLDETHWALRGRTHTVWEFDVAREQRTVAATLQAIWRNRAGGGSLDGSIGYLSDGSGRIQAYLPNSVDRNAVVGPSGEVEVDVIAGPTNGEGAHILLTACDFLPVLGDQRALDDVLRRLNEQMGSLDTSVMILAMRPIR